MLVFLQRRPFEADIPVPKEFWTNPYFIRFFYNIVRYWSRLYLKREPDENEFAEIFMKTIYYVTNSTSDMLRAENTLRESFSHMLTAGEFAAENYGASLSRAVGLPRVLVVCLRLFSTSGSLPCSNRPPTDVKARWRP